MATKAAVQVADCFAMDARLRNDSIATWPTFALEGELNEVCHFHSAEPGCRRGDVVQHRRTGQGCGLSNGLGEVRPPAAQRCSSP